MLGNVTGHKKESWKTILQMSLLQLISQKLYLECPENAPICQVQQLGRTELTSTRGRQPPREDQGEPQTSTNWLSARQGAALTVFPRCPSHLPSCGPLSVSFGMWALCNEGGKRLLADCTQIPISVRFCVKNEFTCEHFLDLLTHDKHSLMGKPMQRSG